jgi:uncharacterized protein
MTIKSKIIKAAEILGRKFKAREVILFGSQARGTANRHSDVDLLVVCPVRRNRYDLMTAMGRAIADQEFAKDIVVMTPREFDEDKLIPGTVARPAWKEGRILYEAARQGA